MKYEIVTAESIDSLIEKVNKWIAEGWSPLGGIAVRQPLNLMGLYQGAQYFQAVTIQGEKHGN